MWEEYAGEFLHVFFFLVGFGLEWGEGGCEGDTFADLLRL